MAEDSVLQKLNKFYTDGTDADKEVYAEMRSNILLVSGDHFQKRSTKWMSTFREGNLVPEDQRIRIVKNHVGRIFEAYVNRFLKQAPTSTIIPRNEKEQQDLKSAELHSSVLEFIKDEYKLKEKTAQLANDYVQNGECWARLRWDWKRGKLKSKKQKMKQVTNEDGTVTEEPGDVEHEFTGALVIDRIFAFNIFRPKDAMSLEDAAWIGVRYMDSKDSVLMDYSGKDENIKKKLEGDADTTFLVFDNTSANYKEDSESILVKEVYYRPSPEYPNGYFYKYTKSVILEEGELPFGLFPLVFSGYAEISTTPRFRSPIRQWKPFQLEINRMSSKIAEHQITLGDDKVLIFNGGKISPGGVAPGIRGVSVNGSSAQMVAGRTGAQYLEVLNAMISEMYQVAMVDEEINGKVPSQIDPYALLISTSKWKERFSRQIEKFEKFVCDISELALEITRAYIEEDMLIQIIGKNEHANIPEFKNSNTLCYQIQIKPSSDDVNDVVGKKMSLDRLLQYAGSTLSKEDIGKVMRLDPYLGKEQIFNDLTMSYDNAVNDILAMDRGQFPTISRYRYKDPNYAVEKFSHRMGQSDFETLDPKVQQIYAQVIQTYEQMIVKMAQDQAALNSEFIPTSGPLVRTDMWIPDPKNPEKQVRMSIPSDSLGWLQQRLEGQGSTYEALQRQQSGVISDVVNQMRQTQAANRPQGQPTGMEGAPPQAQQLQMMLQQAKAGQA